MGFQLLSCGIIVGLALIHDGKGSMRLITVIITLRGITWLCQKITGSINRDASELINFAGWSICGVSIIGIIKNAMEGFKPISECFVKTGESIAKIEMFFGNIANSVDRITFWD